MQSPIQVAERLREHARRILAAGAAAAEPGAALRRALRLEGDQLRIGDSAGVPLPSGGRIWLVGAGKAAARMTERALGLLDGRVAGGTLTVTEGTTTPLQGMEVWEAGHPVPDVRGLAGASEALHLARGAREEDLVVCLLSGGASALWPAPVEGVTLADLQEVTRVLLRAGAPIAEVNAVRKHLSRIAGGQLARVAAPARVLTLAVSDVIGASPDAIGSGPTLPDPTTFADALAVLRGHAAATPPSVMLHLQRGVAGEVAETVKPGELVNLEGFHIVLSVRDALEGAVREAERLGYRPRVVTDALEGEARQVGDALAREALRAGDEGDRPLALLWGGETTVTVRGHGRGGRNQELALAAALALQAHPGVVVGSMGTDGRDGPTDAAGAVVDGATVERGREAGLDARRHLDDNDSHRFLSSTGDLLVTGPTGTNVNDVMVALVG